MILKCHHIQLVLAATKEVTCISKIWQTRYHPHLITFCLVCWCLAKRVIRVYCNYFKQKPGFNEENISTLKHMTKQLFDVQRYVVVPFDEMRIHANFASDKHSNKLTGFVDQDDEVSASNTLAAKLRNCTRCTILNFSAFEVWTLVLTGTRSLIGSSLLRKGYYGRLPRNNTYYTVRLFMSNTK